MRKYQWPAYRKFPLFRFYSFYFILGRSAALYKKCYVKLTLYFAGKSRYEILQQFEQKRFWAEKMSVRKMIKMSDVCNQIICDRDYHGHFKQNWLLTFQKARLANLQK